MRRKVRSQFFSFVTLLVLASAIATILLPHTTYAADCEGIQTAVVDCGDTGDTTGSPVVSILVLVIQILTAAVGVVAIGAFVYAGIMWSSASGDSGRINKAKEIIRNTVIGLAAFALMSLALNYLIPGGLFTGTAKFGAGGNGLGTVLAKNITIKNDANGDDSTVPDPTNGACYWDRGGAYPKGKNFHIDNTKSATTTNSYSFENSPEGIKYASEHGYTRIDIDIQTTKDGVIVATHSTNPFMTKGKGTWGGFYDPAGNVKKGLIQDLTFAQVSVLRHKVGGYKIHRLEDILAAAKKYNMYLSLEFKTPKTLKNKMGELTKMVNEAHVKAITMGITSKSGQVDALTVARKHGFWASYIFAGTRHAAIKTSTCG